MWLSHSGDEVDGQVEQLHVSVRAKAHVVDHFGREQHPKSLLAVSQRREKALAVPVGVVVVRVRV